MPRRALIENATIARRDPVPDNFFTNSLAAACTAAVAPKDGIEADSSSTSTTFSPQRAGSGGLKAGAFTVTVIGVPLLGYTLLLDPVPGQPEFANALK